MKDRKPPRLHSTGAGESRPVYSTDPGFVPPCPTCGEPPDRCKCGKTEPPAAGAPSVRVRLEKKGRGGKAVTLIEGASGGPEAIEELARSLKQACATGGTIKGRVIELQGDQRERVGGVLSKRGYRVQRGN